MTYTFLLSFYRYYSYHDTVSFDNYFLNINHLSVEGGTYKDGTNGYTSYATI